MKPISLLFILFISVAMSAQNQLIPSVDVTGEGIVNVVPDQVTVNLRVEHTGKDAKEVKLKNDAVVNDVLKYIKKMNIDSKYVKTEYIRLSKNYEYNTKTYNYAANQAISVKLMDLSKYESLMNGLLDTGINRIDGVSFSSSQQAALASQARKKAIENAKLKAIEYSSVLGQSIGKAIQISEFQQSAVPGPMFKSALAMDSGGNQQTLAPGEMEIMVKVNVRFELK